MSLRARHPAHAMKTPAVVPTSGPPLVRQWNGMNFSKRAGNNSLEAAKLTAKAYHEQGFRTRIVRVPKHQQVNSHPYLVYIRHKG